MELSFRDKFLHTLIRVLFSLIFVAAGFHHLLNTESVSLRLMQLPAADLLSSLAPIEIHVVMAGVVLCLGGLGLLLGFWTRWIALALAAVLIPITLSVQLEGMKTMGPLFKNIALFGGLLYFAAFGTSGLCLDHWLKGRSQIKMALTSVKLVAMALFVFALTPFPAAQSFEDAVSVSHTSVVQTSKPVAVLVKKTQHLKVAIKTLSEGKIGKDGLTVGRAKIIVCGKQGVSAIQSGSALEAPVQAAREAGIQILACGLSLNKAGIGEGELIEGVGVVDNGLWEMIRLKLEGYIGVDL